MADCRASFTRASGTRVEIEDDGIATISFRSADGPFARITTVVDLIAEWRMFGAAIAAWEDRQAGKLRRFPVPPRPCAIDGEH